MPCRRGDIDWKASPSLFFGPTGTVSPQFVPTLTAAGPVGLTLIFSSDCFWLPEEAFSLPSLLSLPQAATVNAAAAIRLASVTRLQLISLLPIGGSPPPNTTAQTRSRSLRSRP